MNAMLRAFSILLPLGFLPLSMAAADPCDELGPEAGPPALSVALEAYAQLDPETFAASLDQAEAGIACLERDLSTEEQTQLWLARGLDGWLQRDKQALVLAFAPLVAVDPDIAPGPELIAPGSALDKALIAARAAAAQGVEDAESVSTLVDAPAPAPRHHTSWALLGTGVAMGAVAGTSAIISQRAEQRFWGAEVRSDAQAAYSLNRTAGFTAYGAAGISAGLLVGAVFTGRW
jgi:hypothetical protein